MTSEAGCFWWRTIESLPVEPMTATALSRTTHHKAAGGKRDPFANFTQVVARGKAPRDLALPLLPPVSGNPYLDDVCDYYDDDSGAQEADDRGR